METQLAVPADTGGVRIRDAQPSDREFIFGLIPELFTFDSPPAWRDVPQMITVDERVICHGLDGPSGSRVLVAEDEGGQRIGFIHLCETEDHYGGKCGHVSDIVVAPWARGRGVGKALLTAGEHWSRERGYALLTLNVLVENTGARALYDAAGFKAETVRYVKPLT